MNVSAVWQGIGVSTDEGRRRWTVALAISMTLPFIASLFYFIFLGESALAKLVYSGTKGFMLIWPILCVHFLFRAQLPRRWAVSLPNRRVVLEGVFSGLLVIALMVGLLQTPFATIMEGATPSIQGKITRLGLVPYYFWFALFLSLAHSLIEEYYWRWFVYGHLRKLWGVFPAVVLGSIAFAAHHVVVLSVYFPLAWAFLFGAAVAIGGAFWCLLYERHGTLWGAWISHILVDLGIMAIGWQILIKDI